MSSAPGGCAHRCWSLTVATGEVGEFRGGLDARQLPYVVQIKADTSAYAEQVRPERLPYKGRGQPSKPRYREPRSQVKQLVLAAGQAAGVDLIWRRGSKGLQRSQFVALRVRPAGVAPRRQATQAPDRELPVRWLLAEWPVTEPEPTAYWLSNPDFPPGGGHRGYAAVVDGSGWARA